MRQITVLVYTRSVDSKFQLAQKITALPVLEKKSHANCRTKLGRVVVNSTEILSGVNTSAQYLTSCSII